MFPRTRGWLIAATLSVAFAAGLFAQNQPVPAELQASFNRGRVLYLANCSMCHQVTGRGTKGTYPPLAASDWLANNL